MTPKTTKPPITESQKQYTPLEDEASPENAAHLVNQIAAQIKNRMKSKGAKLK